MGVEPRGRTLGQGTEALVVLPVDWHLRIVGLELGAMGETRVL